MALPGLNGSDAESEPMDMSSDSDTSDSDRQQVGHKRKRSSSNGDSTDNEEHTDIKRARTAEPPTTLPDLSQKLPHGVWQRVFLLLPPAMLFRLMRVNKRFKYLLERAKEAKVPPRKGPAPVQMMESEAVWMQSRRNAYPSLPRPLAGLNEAEMLRMCTARRCSNCAKEFPPSITAGPLNGGPGPNGVRAIWQFKRTLCGACLHDLSMTDVELFKLKGELKATDLRKGLNFVFLTRDYNVVSEQIARQHTTQGIVKVYLRSGVDDIINEFKEAQDFGGGAQEEWVKGLDEVGKIAAADAMRWQRWEDQLPSGITLPSQLRKLDPVSFTGAVVRPMVQSPPRVEVRAPVSSMHPPMPPNTVHPLPKPVHSIAFEHLRESHAPRNGLPSHQDHQPGNRTESNGFRSRPADEAQRVIRARRAEIERRAAQMVPAIETDVLQLMDAYKAATMIGLPLTDSDWDHLRPRLEAERERAEQMRYEQVQTLAALHAANPINWQYPQGILQQTKDDDREWEVSQGPLRDMLGRFADDVINVTWRAQPLTAELVPYFAADVLTGVHSRYQSHRHNSSEQDMFDFLSLDAMKWVFENKVKPLAEPLLKEMFMCAGCHDERITKWLAFEGLIQHYGAKHTTDFSRGNITVHWQTAEWTDEPPFVTDVGLLYPKQRKQVQQPVHHRARRAAPIQPSAEQMLSSNPLFAAPVLPTVPLFNEEAALLKISLVGRQVWAELGGIRGMNESIRVIAVNTHCFQDFRSHHARHLPLELYIKAFTINENSSFTELKDVGSLTCSFCEPTARQSEKKQYKLPALLNHFQLMHMSQGVPEAEWVNVADEPAKEELLELLKTPGMNDSKLALIATAWPAVFPHPVPIIGEVKTPPPDSGLARRLVMKGLAQAAGGKKKKKANAAREYNPNDAIIPQKPAQGPVDLSMFDTDPVPTAPPPPAPAGQPDAAFTAAFSHFNLAPETLAALQSLNRSVGTSAATQASQIPPELSRTQTASPTPSIGADAAYNSFQPPARAPSVVQNGQQATPPAYGLADADPNISAIIASLHRGSNQHQAQHGGQPYMPPPLAPGTTTQQQYMPAPPPPATTPQQPYPPPQAASAPSYPQQHYMPPAPSQQPPAYQSQQYLPQGVPPPAMGPTPPFYAPPQGYYGYQQFAPQPGQQMQQWPPQQPNAPPQMQQYGYRPAAPPQMQPVPGNPRLMFDPRTGQYYELVPDE